MYGTIMRGTFAPENRAALAAAIGEGERVPVPGFLGSHLMFPDGREDEVWLVVFFEDKAAYDKNAADPAQHDRYVKFRALLEADPVWTDGAWETFRPE